MTSSSSRQRLQRIGIVGAESTGKSTLVQALALDFGPAAASVAEYARSRWNAMGSSGFTYADMLPIAQQQVQIEEQTAAAAPPNCCWLLCDTTPLATLYYSLASFGKAPLALWALSARAYDMVLLCAPDMPFVQDGQRSSEAFRQRQHAWFVQALAERDVAYGLLQGDVPGRVQQAREAMAVLEMPEIKLDKPPPRCPV